MMHKEIDINKPLTDAHPDEPDADCPKLTETLLSQFQKAYHFQAEQRQLHHS